MAETEDLKSFQYRFESDRGHQFIRKSLHPPQKTQGQQLGTHTQSKVVYLDFVLAKPSGQQRPYLKATF